ncbi:MAG: agmatinase [Myxococcales bacterium]|nr:agmatinase [Myxococcales bacterium]
MKPNYYDIPEPFFHREQARAAIIPIPYERTVSFGAGTGLGPEAILRASHQVEFYDEFLGLEPYRAGIFSEPLGNPKTVSRLSPAKMIERYAAIVARHLDEGRFPIVLGGEHTVALAPFAAAIARHPDLHVLQFDAHADLREQYEDDPYSHACAARRMVERAPVTQIGIRSYDKEQAAAYSTLPVKVLHAWEIRGGRDPLPFLEAKLGDPVYLTIDLDVFDLAEMPATGTPEPGGLSWHEVDRMLAWLFAHRRVIGLDVVELAPLAGLHAPDFLAARLIYRAIGRRLGEGTLQP